MEISPPSQPGSIPLINTPSAANSRLKAMVADSDCRNTARAPCISPAPILCATCTENPVAAAAHNPQKSHVVVETSPMEADASAPRLPTIAASIYCIIMEDNCAMTAGMLSCTVRRSCCPNVIGLPSRLNASNPFVFSACVIIVRSFLS